MTVIRLRLSLFLCLAITGLFAGNGYVYLGDTTHLYLVQDNQIYSADGAQLLYRQSGNIFFAGGNDDKDSIYLMTTSMDLGSRKLQMLYEKDDRKPFVSFADNRFYAGTPDFSQREQSELMHVERHGKWTSFYSSINDSLIGYYNADSLPPSTAIITAYSLINHYLLIQKLNEKNRPVQITQSGQFSSIKPAWGNTTDNEWIWDGQTLRLRWNPDPRYVWTFDGKTVKQATGNNIYAQYEWDGESFKPLWRSNRAEEWSWDGRVLKPTWNQDWDNQYTLEDGVLKPWSSMHPEREWNVQGDIPIPLLIIVISGMARAN